MLKYSLGIDVSKASFHACLSTIDAVQKVKVQRSGTFTNNERGFKALMVLCAKEHKDPTLPFVVVMEATGVYYERLAFFLYAQGMPVSVVLPNKAKKYIAALGIKTKNDSADAKALSKMGAEQALDCWQPMGDFFYTLRALTRHYQSLQAMATALGNQAEAMECAMHQTEAVDKSNELLIGTVEAQVKALSKAISAHLRSDKGIWEKVKHLIAIKGVGELTVAVILAETNGFALFTSARQLVSYSGYDVVENQSGGHVGKTKISKRGNGRIRRALHMPSLCVITAKVSVFKDLYERIYERTGIKMKAYVAVQKKLLTTMYALWSKNEAFDVEYASRKEQTTSDEEAVFSSRQPAKEVRQRQRPMNEIA